MKGYWPTAVRTLKNEYVSIHGAILLLPLWVRQSHNSAKQFCRRRDAAIWRCLAISNSPQTPGREFLSRIERWSILNRNPFSILLASHPGWKQKEDSYGHDNVISYCFGRHFARRGRLGILSLERLKAYCRARKPRFAKGNTAARGSSSSYPGTQDWPGTSTSPASVSNVAL